MTLQFLYRTPTPVLVEVKLQHRDGYWHTTEKPAIRLFDPPAWWVHWLMGQEHNQSSLAVMGPTAEVVE